MMIDKNLVIIHLESVSSNIYFQNQECFQNLNFWRDYLSYYPNYYSTATSTLMVISDLFMGSMMQFESSRYLEDLDESKKTKDTIFDVLRQNNYRTKCMFAGFGDKEKDRIIKLKNILDKNSGFWFGDDESEMKIQIEQFISEDRPFALFLCDIVSHVSYKGNRLKKDGSSVDHYFAQFSAMDRTVGILFEILRNCEKLKNTIVLLYGDHGDAYWSHGLYEGYTHAIPPYPGIIHCPLWVYDCMKDGMLQGDLLSTEDLFDLVLRKLELSERAKVRKYVYSRNLFSAQTKKQDVFEKAYSVTDGKYTLLTSKKGLRLYSNYIDPYSTKNLLDFFVLKGQKISYEICYQNLISGHYHNFMTTETVRQIEDEFSNLYIQMCIFIRRLIMLKTKISLSKIAYGKNVKIERLYYKFKLGKIRLMIEKRFLS